MENNDINVIMASKLSQGVKSVKRRSRKGCLSCKRSKVKCDEQHPTCGRCFRRGTECEYPVSTRSTPTETTGDSSVGVVLNQKCRVTKDMEQEDAGFVPHVRSKAAEFIRSLIDKKGCPEVKDFSQVIRSIH